MRCCRAHKPKMGHKASSLSDADPALSVSAKKRPRKGTLARDVKMQRSDEATPPCRLSLGRAHDMYRSHDTMLSETITEICEQAALTCSECQKSGQTCHTQS